MPDSRGCLPVRPFPEARRTVLAAAAALLAAAVTAAPAAERAGNGDLVPPTLTVSGDAESRAAPDLAVVRIGAEAQAKTARDAQERVNGVVAAATEAVRGLGIAAADVRTQGLHLHPVYGSERQPPVEAEEPRLVGYRAASSLEVLVTDLPKVGPVIDAAMRSGANRLDGVTFELRDDLEARRAALRAAAREARAKAEALAAEMDVTLGVVQEIVEGGAAIDPPRPFLQRSVLAGMEATPVEPGEVRVHASVTVTFRIEARAGARAAEGR